MRRISLLILAVPLLGFGIWLWTGQVSTVSRSLFAMGTVFEITASGANADRAVEQAFSEIKRVEALTSNLNESELHQVNQASGIKPVEVSPDLIAILTKTSQFYHGLAGSFDPTVGPLIDLWGFNPQGQPRLPRPELINRTLPLIGFNKVILNPKSRTVYLSVPGMKLDLGGIAKGYAVDRAYQVLRKNGIHSALINGGSSSIRAIGKKLDRNDWKLGIGHPRQSGKLLGTLGLPEDRALGTSADTQNFFIHNGKRYSHLINPRSGYPARDKILVTVTARTAIEADLLSTAFFILPVSEVKAFLAAHPEFRAIIFDASGKLTNLGETTFRAE